MGLGWLWPVTGKSLYINHVVSCGTLSIDYIQPCLFIVHVLLLPLAGTSLQLCLSHKYSLLLHCHTVHHDTAPTAPFSLHTNLISPNCRVTTGQVTKQYNIICNTIKQRTILGQADLPCAIQFSLACHHPFTRHS